MADHDAAGPSALPRIVACPGSLQLSEGEPNESGRDAKLGTAAHTVGAWGLTTGLDAIEFIGERIEVEGETFTVDDEMAAAVQVYLDFVRTYHCDQIWVEERLDIPVIGTFGSCDVYGIKRSERRLVVVDYKHGSGVLVSGEDNHQTRAYAWGAYCRLERKEAIEVVDCAIVQPRMDNIVTARYTPDELKAWALEVGDIVHEARTAISPRLAWGKQCRFCPAKAKCPEVKKMVVDTTGVVFEDLTKPAPLSREAELAGILPKLALIEDWCTEVRADANRLARAGKVIPGYKLVEGRRGNREWSDEKKAESLMKEKFRIQRDDMYSFKVIGPPDAEKLLAKASPRRWRQLQALIHQKPGSPALVPESDKRPAIAASTPVVFDDLSTEDLA